jgi:hypothetical protein
MEGSLPVAVPARSGAWLGATRSARLARLVMLAAGMTWAVLQYQYRGVHEREWWVTMVEHGAEGALVGALCDWFAISKVYAAARANFTRVADAVAELAMDIALPSGGRVSPARLRDLLESAKATETVVELVRRRAPDRDAVESQVRDQWAKRVRPGLVEWLATVDLRTALLDGVETPALLEQPAIRHVVERCLRAALSDPQRTRRLRDRFVELGRGVTLASLLGVSNPAEARELLRRLHDEHARERTIGWLASADLRGALRSSGGRAGLLQAPAIRSVVAHNLRHATGDLARTHRLLGLLQTYYGDTVVARPMGFAVTFGFLLGQLDPRTVHAYMSKVAEAVEAPPDAASGAWQQLGQEYLVAYLDAWHGLGEAERLAAAAAIHDAVLPELIDGLADVLFESARHATVEELLDRTVSTERLHGLLSKVAEAFSRPVGTDRVSWAPALREYAGAWLETWAALPLETRRLGARQLVALGDGLLVATVTDALWSVREQVVTVGWKGSLADIGWLRELAQFVGGKLADAGDLKEEGRRRLAAWLRGLDPDAFIHELRRHTQEPLDAIQLNGALLGLGLGGAAGLFIAAL